MSGKVKDLYGSAPDKHPTALLIIDMINDMQFPDAPMLLEFAVPMAGRIKVLTARARAAGVPIVYVNDNFGRWRSDFKTLVNHCLRSPGKKLARLLKPQAKDYFVLKPKHSGFHSTTLELLLHHLGARRLILTGMASNICVLFTANDGYLRDFKLAVPRDCVCANTQEENDHALKQMEEILKADTGPASRLKLK